MALDPEIANPAALGYLQNALSVRRQQAQQGFQNNLAMRDQGLQEQQFQTQQNALQTQQSTAQQKMNAEQALAGARIVRMAAQKGQDPKKVAEAIAPNFIQDFEKTHGAGSWQQLQPEQVLNMVDLLEQKSMAQLGMSPEAPVQQMKTIEGPDGAILQVDPTTGKMTQVMGRGVERQEVTNMTPYQAAQVDLDRQRLDLDRQKATTATGPASVTEAERKGAVLGARLEGALRELSAVEKIEPGASRPTLTEKAAGVFGETAANVARGPNRQRADTAQLDALDAALTLATGAAYTKEQIQALRKSYFPQIGDSDDVVKAKQARFNMIVETARIASGRAAPSIDAAQTQPVQGQPAGGWTVRRK